MTLCTVELTEMAKLCIYILVPHDRSNSIIHDGIYTVITGSQYQESNDSSSDLEVAEDRSEITMREAQTWKTDILANSHYTPQDLPMMVLVNERETETECREQINGKDEKLDQEQLSELAIKNGFTSW